MLLGKIQRLSKLTLSLLLALTIVGLSTKAETNAQAGITVAPAILSFDLKTDNEQQVAYIGVKNNYKVSIDLIAELKGVDAEDGILAPTKDLDSKYADVITVAPSSFSLGPNESINVQISVKNSSNLGPGGNYAALVIRQGGSSAGSIGLRPAISASLFIIKEQGAKRQLEVGSFQLHRRLLEMPSNAGIEFINTGNVVAVPRGIVTVGNQSLEKIYQKGVVNEGSLSLWPGKQLALKVPISQIEKRWLPGKQTVTLQYRTEGDDTIKTYQMTFVYVPTYYFLIIPVLLIAVWLSVNFCKKRQKNRRLTQAAKSHIVKTIPIKTVKKITISDGE